MGLRSTACLIIALCLFTGCDKPATGPDLSSPKNAALAFANALERGDVATAKMASSAGGLENDLVAAMAESASGIRHLDKVATAKFGDDAKRLVTLKGSTALAKDLAAGDVDQTAERATVRSRDGKESIQLQRVDGLWKVDIGALVRGQDISGVIPMFQAAGFAGRQLAGDIESGKCKSVDEAKVEMADLMNAKTREFRLAQYSAATKPAAPDSTTPAAQ